MSQEMERRPEDEEPVLRKAEFHELTIGPVPSPDVLEGYERIVPGSAKLIFDNFEAESTHRRKLESEASNRDSFRSVAGMIAGFVVALLLIAAAVYTIREGHPGPGATIIVGGLASAVSIFVTGSRFTNKPK